MRLYTVQPKEVWEQIKSGQDFICNKKKSEYLDETNIANKGFIIQQPTTQTPRVMKWGIDVKINLVEQSNVQRNDTNQQT